MGKLVLSVCFVFSSIFLTSCSNTDKSRIQELLLGIRKLETEEKLRCDQEIILRKKLEDKVSKAIAQQDEMNARITTGMFALEERAQILYNQTTDINKRIDLQNETIIKMADVADQKIGRHDRIIDTIGDAVAQNLGNIDILKNQAVRTADFLCQESRRIDVINDFLLNMK
jgi:hypothetical protein